MYLSIAENETRNHIFQINLSVIIKNLRTQLTLNRQLSTNIDLLARQSQKGGCVFRPANEC